MIVCEWTFAEWLSEIGANLIDSFSLLINVGLYRWNVGAYMEWVNWNTHKKHCENTPNCRHDDENENESFSIEKREKNTTPTKTQAENKNKANEIKFFRINLQISQKHVDKRVNKTTARMDLSLVFYITFLLRLASANNSSSESELPETLLNMYSNEAVMVLDDFTRELCIRQSCEYGQHFSLTGTSRASSSSSKRQIHVAVLLPSKETVNHSDKPVQTLSTTLPVIELAIETVKEKQMLEGIELVTHARDTHTSSTIGPMEAFDLHNSHEADVFLGPIDDYVLAPVARFATVWRTPVLTTGGLAGAFNDKVKFSRSFL